MRKIILFLSLLFIISSVDAQVKRVLLEQFTGSWCGWCVDGSYVMEQLSEEYPDQFIGVKIHNGDSMALPIEAEIRGPLGITGFPMGAVDRRAFGGSTGLSRTSWKAAAEASMAIAPKVDVQTYYFINEETRQINIKVYCSLLEDISNTVRFNAYVIEDSVSGEGTGWDQSNYLSGRSGYEDNPYYDKPSKIVGYQHMKTVRAVLGGVFGEGEIPTTSTVGDIVSYDFSYDMPEEWKIKDISVVGFVQIDEANNKEILNCSKGVIGEPEMQLVSTGASSGVSPAGTPMEKSYTLKNISSGPITFTFSINNSDRTPSDWTGSIIIGENAINVQGTDPQTTTIDLAAEEQAEFVLQLTPGTTLGVGDVTMIISNEDNPEGFNNQGTISCFSQEIENFEVISPSETDYSISGILEGIGYENVFQISKSEWLEYEELFPNKNHVIWNTGAVDGLTAADVNEIIAEINEGQNLFICGNLVGSNLSSNGGLAQFGISQIGYSTQGYGSAPWRVWLSGVKGDPISNSFGTKTEGNLINYLINLFEINEVETTKPILHLANGGYKVQVVNGARDTSFISSYKSIFGVRVKHENSRSVLMNLCPFVIKNEQVRTELIKNIMTWLNNEGPELDISDEIIDFKYVEIDETKKFPIILYNPGTAPLTISDINIGGKDSYAFTLDLRDQSIPLTIPAGEYKNFMIEFNPVNENDFIANLNISSNATMNPDVSLAITGYSIFSNVMDSENNLTTTISPNPASNFIILKDESIQSINNISISIYSEDGKVISTIVKDSQSLNQGIHIDMSELNSGAYIIAFEVDGTTYTKKLVITK